MLVLKEKPDQKNLGFGKYMTDYMFVMDWTKEDGWKDARIVPEGPITMDPACVTLHYAQETFEGMKAFLPAPDSPAAPPVRTPARTPAQ